MDVKLRRRCDGDGNTKSRLNYHVVLDYKEEPPLYSTTMPTEYQQKRNKLKKVFCIIIQFIKGFSFVLGD